MTTTNHTSGPSRRSLRGLGGLNFLTADVRDGFGRCLSVFLEDGRHRQPGDIGIATAVSSVSAALPAARIVFALFMPETKDVEATA